MRGPTDGGARDLLRAGTKTVHHRLHRMPAFAALAEGRISLAGYAAMLRRMLGFHAALEAELARVPGLEAFGLDLGARRRSHLLRLDLATFDLDDRVPMAWLPPFDDAAGALGGLYVAEGSTLGGRQLARALDGLLPPGTEGRRFLLGHGERHGEMWRACCAAIERCGRDPNGRAAMLRSAQATFAAFEAWFDGLDPAPAAPVALEA